MVTMTKTTKAKRAAGRLLKWLKGDWVLDA